MHLSSYKDCWLIIGVVSCQRGCLAPLNKNAKASPLLPSSRSKKNTSRLELLSRLYCVLVSGIIKFFCHMNLLCFEKLLYWRLTLVVTNRFVCYLVLIYFIYCFTSDFGLFLVQKNFILGNKSHALGSKKKIVS